MPERPGRKRDRRADRLEATWRERDRQAFDLAGQALLQPPGDRLDMPVVQVCLPWGYGLKCAINECREIVPNCQVENPFFETAHLRLPSPSVRSGCFATALSRRRRRSSTKANTSGYSSL